MVALDQVNFDLKAGEIHALCGENGAGKSTLMNILSGNQAPNEGTIELRGKAIKISNQKHAQELGIGIVYQEKSLINELSVADNIFAGNQPAGRWGLVDRKALYRRTVQLLTGLGMASISPQELVSGLSPGKQQMIEIAKALARSPEILILDEPTASISESDAHLLFGILKDLKKKGTGIIYISHRMSEIFDISDRISVLKDGQGQGTLQTSETNIDAVIKMMVGRDLQHLDYQNHCRSATVLEINGLSGSSFRDVSFSLVEGEILGLAGLVGAGRTEMARVIFGIDRKWTGSISVDGRKVSIDHPQDAIRFSIGYLPEHRKEQGLFLEMTVQENLVATDLNAGQSKSWWIQPDLIHAVSTHYVDRLDIRTPDLQQKAINLSGGNQQKIVLAKWLLLNPRVLMVDEPTQGIDVGAKSEIYKLFNQLTKGGTSLLIISSELTELIGICDRILVMCQGEMTAILDRHEFSEEEIMQYSSGIKNMFRPGSLDI